MLRRTRNPQGSSAMGRIHRPCTSSDHRRKGLTGIRIPYTKLSSFQPMKTYEMKIQYLCVSEGETTQAPHVGTADKVVEYMKGAFDERPEQESFWVICVNRKNRARAR